MMSGGSGQSLPKDIKRAGPFRVANSMEQLDRLRHFRWLAALQRSERQGRQDFTTFMARCLQEALGSACGRQSHRRLRVQPHPPEVAAAGVLLTDRAAVSANRVIFFDSEAPLSRSGCDWPICRRRVTSGG